MDCVAAQVRIVFLLFQSLRMSLGVFLGRVARWRLAFFARLSAFKCNYADLAFFLSHVSTLLLSRRERRLELIERLL